MTLRLRSNTWWWDGYVEGKRQRLSLRTADAREARKRAAEIERAALRGKFIAPERPTMTFRAAYDTASTLRDAWRTSKSAATLNNTFRHLCEAFGEHSALETAGQDEVDQYVLRLVREGVSPSQINTRMSMLSVLRRTAKLPALFMERRKPNKPRKRVFTVAEMNALEQWALDRGEVAYWRLLVLLRETGARLSEPLRANPGDVATYAHENGAKVVAITYRDTKDNGKDRTVPLSTAAQGAAAHLPLGINFDRAQTLWEAARRDLKLGKDAVHHTYRHTFATTWAPIVGPALVAQWLGHTNTRTTAGYTHLNVGHLLPLAQALEGAQVARPQAPLVLSNHYVSAGPA